MPSYLTSIVLEFSEDPLSDTTPTWTDVTSYLREIEWWAGIDREGDEPRPGGARIHLKNINRDFEPEYTGSRFYPNVMTCRRFRLTVNGVQEGVWFIQDFDLFWPSGQLYSEVILTCADGYELLALDDLPALSPPDAEEYADVVAFDEPWGHWRLGDPAGTRVAVSVRKVKRKGDKKGRRKIRRTRRVTRSAVEAVVGPAGVYTNTPSLGQNGLLIGDLDTAVRFDGPASEEVRIANDDVMFERGNAATVEMWCKPIIADAISTPLFSGPVNTTAGNVLQLFARGSGDVFRFSVTNTDVSTQFVESVTTVTVGNTFHVVGVLDGAVMSIYINGVLEAEDEFVGTLATGNDTSSLIEFPNVSAFSHTVVLDEVAVYEHALTAERVAAHYAAGADRGWNVQTAGERIADIATHDLWSTSEIQTAGLDVQPQMKHGQPKPEEISETMHAEGPQTMFVFNGDGNPVYLGYGWKGNASVYNEIQAVFGDSSGETTYDVGSLELIYDNEVYSVVTGNILGGEEIELEDTAAVADHRRRVRTEENDVILANDGDLEMVLEQALQLYREPALRPVTISANGANSLTQILGLDIGHLVEVKKLGEGGVAIDRITHIIGKRKKVDASQHLTCTWTFARGFNATFGYWRLGIEGYSELGTSTTLA